MDQPFGSVVAIPKTLYLYKEGAVTLLEERNQTTPSNSPFTLDLHEIQATVLRYRPEPYYGTHILMHIDDARSGREFLRRLAPHVASAADWSDATDAWVAVAISYSGLAALGVPEESLQSFPEAFRVGMAARADQLLDRGDNHPKNWDQPFGSGKIHVRILLLLAQFGKESKPETVVPKISQEVLAEMIGITRSRVSFFMSRFRKLGFIEYDGEIRVHNTLLNIFLQE